MKLVLIWIAFAGACAGQALPPELVVLDETVPPGQKIQLKMSLTDPRPISVGKTSLSLLNQDFFDAVVGVSLFSSSGDVAGAAVVQGGQVSARFTSDHGTFGLDRDYPIMTVVVGTKAVPVGTRTSVSINPGDSFWAYLGLNYPATVKPGTITAGGSVSVSNVIPGGGLLPAGTVVKLVGTGFDSDTKVQVEDTLPLSSVRFVSSTEIDLTLSSQAEMQGQRIRVTNKDGSKVTYFSYLRPSPLGSSNSHPLLNQTVPIFSKPALGGFLPFNATAGLFTGLALQNSTLGTATVTLDLLIPGGIALGHATVSLPSGARYVREVLEPFGFLLAPTANGIRVTSDVPIQMLGLTGDDTNRTVTPVALTAGPTVSPLTVAPTNLHFDYRIGEPAPAALSVALAASAATPFTVTRSAVSPWLNVTPASGTAPANLSLTINTAGLTPGVYATTLNVTPTSGTAVAIPVTLTVTDSKTPLISALVNAANAQIAAVSPGEIISIYGSFPAVPATGLALDSTGKVATSLAGIRVLFDGVAAPLTFVNATQINAVVPYEISDSGPSGGTHVQVVVGGVPSDTVPQATIATSPAIFTANSSGIGQAAALNQDFSYNTAATPAARNSVISLYATGEGRTIPASVTGGVSVFADQKKPALDVTATIGGQPAQVQFAGAAPGLVAGVMQVNLVVPVSVTPGSAVEVILKVGTTATRAGVTVAVQ